ncbi:MAG: L-seryl-tRNA(Sec) selenium transferase [Acidobacteria bacterium]|nr:MAG: L-seryl-tRNA(Sec) selenium transferase [Acidobacteriota bacterium]
MKTASSSDLYRKIPAVDDLLQSKSLAALVAQEGRATVTDSARTVLTRLREEIASGRLDADGIDLALSGLPEAIERETRQRLRYSLRPVINATGVILHTNLGRAPLLENAFEHIRETAGVYSNLEFDLESGERGKRDVHVDRFFSKLLDVHVGTAAPAYLAERSSPGIATIVVNNNAAAVLLALNTLAESGDVIVSRGELVEIGGSFRIPEIMAKSGAILREVGTTNRTRIADYERAITERTKLLLRVHRSNFQITGFTEQPELQELIALARARNIPLMEDLGSGALVDLRSMGIDGEPTVLDSLDAGVDVVTYSGDKLLGGPQAGMLSGRSDLIAHTRSNPLFRALRAGRLTYAALESTLLSYVKGHYDSIPVIRMIRASEEEISTRAESLANKIESPSLSIELLDGESVIGGGAAPSAVLPTRLMALTATGLSADELAARLRAADYPLIARIEEGRVLLDLRTVLPEQDEALAEVLNSLGIKAG